MSGDWRPSGIDVDALHRAATEVELIVNADELRRRAEAARDAAQARERQIFNARWGSFMKCSRCGAAQGSTMCWCPTPYTWVLAGYGR